MLQIVLHIDSWSLGLVLVPAMCCGVVIKVEFRPSILLTSPSSPPPPRCLFFAFYAGFFCDLSLSSMLINLLFSVSFVCIRIQLVLNCFLMCNLQGLRNEPLEPPITYKVGPKPTAETGKHTWLSHSSIQQLQLHNVPQALRLLQSIWLLKKWIWSDSSLGRRCHNSDHTCSRHMVAEWCPTPDARQMESASVFTSAIVVSCQLFSWHKKDAKNGL